MRCRSPISGVKLKQFGDWWLLRAADGFGLCCSAAELADYLALLDLPEQLVVDGDPSKLLRAIPR